MTTSQAESNSTRAARIDWLLAFAFVALLAGLLVLRRPDLVSHPHVWDEDGTWNIRAFIEHGWGSIAMPVQGYFILVPKIISLLSIKLSFLYYPEISTALGFLFDLAVLVAVWRAPTALPARALCALAVLLIPNGAEVYTLPLYTFWFAGLLVALGLLWTTAPGSPGSTAWRVAFLILGGLSSPLIVAFLPLFALRAYLYRASKVELRLMGLVGVIALVQAIAIALNPRPDMHDNVALVLTPSALGELFTRFVTWAFAYRSQTGAGFLGIGAVGVLAWGLRKEASKLSPVFFFLPAMFAIAVALSVTRKPITVLDPVDAGPRYFFYPYVFLWWLTIGLASYARSWFLKAILLIMIGSGIYVSARHFSRDSDEMDWRTSISDCARGQEAVDVPIHFDGKKSSAWTLPMTADDCRRMVENSLFGRTPTPMTAPMFVEVDATKPAPTQVPQQSSVRVAMVINDWQPNGVYPGTPTLPSTYGSWVGGDQYVGKMRLRLQNAPGYFYIAYRTGPTAGRQRLRIYAPEATTPVLDRALPVASQWRLLRIRPGNALVAGSFNLEIADDGDRWGEWSAVAFNQP